MGEKLKIKDKHCYNCKHLEEIYGMERNDDRLWDRVLVNTECWNPNKDDRLQNDCEYFESPDLVEEELEHE